MISASRYVDGQNMRADLENDRGYGWLTAMWKCTPAAATVDGRDLEAPEQPLL